MTSFDVDLSLTRPVLRRGELALRIVTALLMTAAAALVLIGTEAWSGALPYLDPLAPLY
jgi:hypothetical protein